ncbi:MAG: helix-turn-helix domain-containing protein, partial [Pseudonocardiaceae bacterium]
GTPATGDTATTSSPVSWSGFWSPAPRADRLSLTLRQLRRRADLSGIEAARRAGMSQATISRFETGKRVPTEADIRTLCEVYGASVDTRCELLTIAEDLRAGSTSTRAVLHHHGALRCRPG